MAQELVLPWLISCRKKFDYDLIANTAARARVSCNSVLFFSRDSFDTTPVQIVSLFSMELPKIQTGKHGLEEITFKHLGETWHIVVPSYSPTHEQASSQSTRAFYDELQEQWHKAQEEKQLTVETFDAHEAILWAKTVLNRKDSILEISPKSATSGALKSLTNMFSAGGAAPTSDIAGGDGADDDVNAPVGPMRRKSSLANLLNSITMTGRDTLRKMGRSKETPVDE